MALSDQILRDDSKVIVAINTGQNCSCLTKFTLLYKTIIIKFNEVQAACTVLVLKCFIRRNQTRYVRQYIMIVRFDLSLFVIHQPYNVYHFAKLLEKSFANRQSIRYTYLHLYVSKLFVLKCKINYHVYRWQNLWQKTLLSQFAITMQFTHLPYHHYLCLCHELFALCFIFFTSRPGKTYNTSLRKQVYRFIPDTNCFINI